MLQLEDGTHFPLSPAHSVTSVSAFQFQPAEQGKSTQVKRNDGSPSFPFHRERNYSCGEQVPDPSPGRNRRGLSSCEASSPMSWSGETTVACFLPAEMGACQVSNTEHLFLVLQSPKISGTATDRQMHSK